MKIVKEHINEKFTEDSDPIDDLGIGSRHLIKKWLDEMKVDNYIINDDLTIDVDDYLNFYMSSFEQLPKYIQFNIVSKSMWISHNKNLISLRGCPKKIYSWFCCNNNPKLTSLKYAPQYIENDFIANNCSLTSLRYAPKYVGSKFFCYGNAKQFSIADVKKVCNVKDKIIIKI